MVPNCAVQAMSDRARYACSLTAFDCGVAERAKIATLGQVAGMGVT